MNSPRSWLVWGAGALAYIIAILHRSSLGVAGPDAAERFEVQATLLATLGAVQIGVYAAMQVPVGVLLDRYGPRVLIASGAITMAGGQVLVALAEELPFAVVGRILIGIGDAATFISVIRLQSGWFRGPIVAQMSQWTAVGGQFGQLASAVPFVWLLQQIGWTLSFGTLAILGVVAFVLVLLLVFDAPPGGAPATGSIDVPEGWWPRLKSAFRQPGTRLGFWTHFSLLASTNVFMLLWGFPMLVDGLGYSTTAAAGLMSVVVVTGMVVGPIVGIATARFPLRRSTLVLCIVALVMATWVTVLLWPGHPPAWLVLTLVIVLGIAGPGSTVGFDFARTFNPLRILGSANGIVNIGGFLASFAIMPAIGILLDIVHSIRTSAGEQVDLYDWEGFRIALSSQLVLLALGFAMVVRMRRITRSRLREEGIEVGPIWAAIAQWMRGRKR
ncbi:Sugar phosphate permease [Agrococcus baldri]|uniref:Sugar phosphate permease n=1 Tax=Agrococcus baldri TaxID=153730 RepID=A0AA94HPQ2_9MICO|nr:MFS transporter [Agrococcus baldri]SFS18978.1 Sugar phosphate permease [Agrococcus baldri]